MTPSLTVTPFETGIFRAGENLVDFIDKHVPKDRIENGLILAVTSKIVSLAENRLLAKTGIEKSNLIEQEADHNFGEIGYGCYLTIKHGLFIPSAGIDESNSETGGYILYPEDPFASAARLHEELRKRWGLNTLGILVTDSHTTPLRRGVTGIALAHVGFEGLRNMIGRPDIFGQNLRMTTVNIADGLAAAATLLMGEANERRPLAAIKGADVVFTGKIDPQELKMPVMEDLYFPFFKHLVTSP